MSTPGKTSLQDPEHTQDPAFIAVKDFDQACRSLVERSRDVDLFGMELDLRGEEFQYLVIRKALPTQPSWSQEMIEPIEPTIDLGIENYSLALDSRPELDISDDEDDAAVYHSNAHTPTIEYHIILSPTYRVPVLYFFLHNLSIQRTSSIDAIQLLVPEHLKSGIKDIGVIGGISMANHPITDIPAYFVHPCNTAEAMREIIGNRIVSPLEYLQIWIGQVGSCVGLYLPSQLVVGKGSVK